MVHCRPALANMAATGSPVFPHGLALAPQARSGGGRPLPLNVQCPHCGSVCQVGTQLLGTAVKCGKCTQPFTVQAMAPQPAGAPAVKMSVKPGLDEEIDLV